MAVCAGCCMPVSQSEPRGKGALICVVGSTLGKQLREWALLCWWHRHRLLAVTAPRGHLWGEQGRAGCLPPQREDVLLSVAPLQRASSQHHPGDLGLALGLRVRRAEETFAAAALRPGVPSPRCPPAGLEAVPRCDPSLGLADASPHAGRAALMFLSCRSFVAV